MLCSAQLGEVLDGANHLAGVAVLVVVPGYNLHLIGGKPQSGLGQRFLRFLRRLKCQIFTQTPTVPDDQLPTGLQTQFIIPEHAHQEIWRLCKG